MGWPSRNFRIGVEALARTSRPGTFSQADFEEYRTAWARPGALTGMTRGGLVTGPQLQVLAGVDGVATVTPIVIFPVGDAAPALPLRLASS